VTLEGAPRFVEFPAADGFPLQALLYEPAADRRPTVALLWVHGRGANCYSGPARTLPPLLGHLDCIQLAVNLRSHDLAYVTQDDVQARVGGIAPPLGGVWWEHVPDGALDIAGALDWLRAYATVPIFVVGHSLGGYYLALFSAVDPDIAGRVFLSPLPDLQQSFPSWFPAEGAYDAARAWADEQVAAGTAGTLRSLPPQFGAISAATIVERANETPGAWLDGANGSGRPAMIVWGGQESYAARWRQLAAGLAADVVRTVEVPGTGHNYAGAEPAVADAVAAFIREVSRPGSPAPDESERCAPDSTG
jgi:pimeloyl-ACP methyl ester carboxylesterase